MNRTPYDLPAELHVTSLLPALARLEDYIARLDERLLELPFGPAIAERILYAEACASVAADGLLAHREDLVLIDGHAFDGVPSAALTQAHTVLRIWRKALRGDADALLASGRPGEIALDAGGNRDATEGIWHGCHSETLLEWRSIVGRTSNLPPVLAAAIAADAWLVLQHGSSATWRAPLLAALVLKARRKTRSFLLPLDTGRQTSTWRYDARHGFNERIAGILVWMETAATHVQKELQRVVLAEQLLARKLVGRRKSSRLPDLIDLFLRRPLISVQLAAKALRCSPQAVELMIAALGSTPRRLTERKRYRVWGI